MESEVSRAEFIKYIGLALLGMLGVTQFINHLGQINPSKKTATGHHNSRGYGGGPYGI